MITRFRRGHALLLWLGLVACATPAPQPAPPAVVATPTPPPVPRAPAAAAPTARTEPTPKQQTAPKQRTLPGRCPVDACSAEQVCCATAKPPETPVNQPWPWHHACATKAAELKNDDTSHGAAFEAQESACIEVLGDASHGLELVYCDSSSDCPSGKVCCNSQTDLDKWVSACVPEKADGTLACQGSGNEACAKDGARCATTFSICDRRSCVRQGRVRPASSPYRCMGKDDCPPGAYCCNWGTSSFCARRCPGDGRSYFGCQKASDCPPDQSGCGPDRSLVGTGPARPLGLCGGGY